MRFCGAILSVFICSASLSAQSVSPEVERARLLMKSGARSGPLGVKELHELLKKETVRTWLRRKIVTQMDEWLKEFMMDSARFSLRHLIESGMTERDVQFVADIVRKYTPLFRAKGENLYLKSILGSLMGNAPFSLDEAIKQKLLPVLAKRAAESLDSESAFPLWIASLRFPPDVLRPILDRAWSSAFPANLRMLTKPINRHPRCGVELTITPPEGEHLEDTFILLGMHFWGASEMIIWPDGKARFSWTLNRGASAREQKLRPLVYGFYEHPEKTITLRPGRISKYTVKLPKKRHVMTGCVDPAPETPLFVTLKSYHPRGKLSWKNPLSPYRAMVNSDGSFRVPYTRSKNPNLLLFHDYKGYILHEVEKPPPSEGGDFSVGTITLPEKRTLVTVPVFISWGLELPEKDQTEFRLRWSSVQEGSAEFITQRFSTSLRRLAGKTKSWLMTAYNVLPGGYTITLSMCPQNTQDFTELMCTDCTVNEKGEPLHLLLGVTKEEETGKVLFPKKPIFYDGDLCAYQLHSDGKGNAALVWGDHAGLYLRCGRDVTRAPTAQLLKSITSGGRYGYYNLDFTFGTDDIIHLVTLRGSSPRPCYQRVSMESAGIKEWGDLYQETDLPSGFTFGLPRLFPDRGNTFDVVCAMTLPGRFTSTSMGDHIHWALGRLEGTTYSERKKIGSRKEWFVDALKGRVLGDSLHNARVMFPLQENIAWTSFSRLSPSMAVRGLGRYFQEAALCFTTRKKVFFAAPVPVKDGHHGLWVGEGALGSVIRPMHLLQKPPALKKKPVLAEAPGGDVYLFAPLPGHDGNNVLAFWKVSGRATPQAAFTTVQGRFVSDLKVTIRTADSAVAAWTEDGRLRVENFSIGNKTVRK